MNDEDFKPRLGAIRGMGNLGMMYANPGDLLFSTVTMIATEVYGQDGWERIIPEDEDTVAEESASVQLFHDPKLDAVAVASLRYCDALQMARSPDRMFTDTRYRANLMNALQQLKTDVEAAAAYLDC